MTRHLARVVGCAVLGAAAAFSASGQQTIFNVPTADVLDKGKLYLETDWLWRPSAPGFAVRRVFREKRKLQRQRASPRARIHRAVKEPG